MSLAQNQEATMTAMAAAFKARMVELFPLPEDLSEEEKDKIKANWEKLGQAVAAILAATMSHIVANAEIGTVESEVQGNVAVQSNSGEGLIQ